MKMSVSVTGGAELVRNLERLSANTRGEVLENAVVAGALLVVNAAKEKAPYLTGNLRRSIHVGGHATEDMGNASKSDLTELRTKSGRPYRKKRYIGSTGTDIGGNRRSAHSAEVLVGTNVEYAAAQEYGTSRGVPAHPYLRPAFDENRDKVADEIKAAIRAQLVNL
jgi:HK97 gp10 family phage protein